MATLPSWYLDVLRSLQAEQTNPYLQNLTRTASLSALNQLQPQIPVTVPRQDYSHLAGTIVPVANGVSEVIDDTPASTPVNISEYPETMYFEQVGDGVSQEIDARERGVPPIPEGLILGNPALEQRAAEIATAKNSADVMQEVVNLTTPKPKARTKTRAKTAPVQTRVKNEPKRVANQIYERYL